MALQFQNKIALVTGAGSGIGRASALEFAKEGAKVVVVDIDLKGGKETVHLIQKKGGEALFVRADISKSQETRKLIKKVIRTYGQLDFAHNNAGVGSFKASVSHCTEENWDRVHDINLKGVWLCMKYEIPYMLKRRQGVIINTSSIFGMIGLKNHAAYVASKHGVTGLTKTAAMECAARKVRVNAICPGTIATPLVGRVSKELIAQHPLGRIGTAEEVAKAVIWLCSDDAAFITGHCLVIDGGRMLPY